MASDRLYALYLAGCNGLLRLPGHRLRIAILRLLVRADIGADCAIERGVRVTTKGGLRIGSQTNVNARVLLDARGGLTIGSRVNISPEVAILTAEHDPQSATFEGRLRPVVIADGAWLAFRATVLPGTDVGEGAIVAAGAVVGARVEPRTIVAGNPTTVIGERDPGAQARLAPYRRFLH